ncbi:hypothetical protein [Rhizobium miluonense]|uniref:Uncharacterized protein n=1 Tax=Rhizobium miluonense TaxID=411945 RepID=A0A1C3WD71_9HYPH|nr:hypothetical protein [Rhizobium miluonense]SCB37835.1 hypothetical protein GA0061102_102711 [Rhizobium miluonense]
MAIPHKLESDAFEAIHSVVESMWGGNYREETMRTFDDNCLCDRFGKKLDPLYSEQCVPHDNTNTISAIGSGSLG